MSINTGGGAHAPKGERRRRRAWGAIEQLPSGRFRARMVAPDGRYVSAPTTFTSRRDAAVWLDLQHADMVRGVWKVPRRSTGTAYTVGEYVARWIEQHPRAKNSTKELYRGLLRRCIDPDIGDVNLDALTSDTVRVWHYRLGLRLAAAWSGLRQGELLALTRADLDLDATPPVVRIRRRVRRNDDGSIDVDTPKSTASLRAVALPGPLRDALVDHLAHFGGDEEQSLVFATVNGTVPARSSLTQMLHRATDAADVPTMRFHDLRHCAQVLAAESGATLAELMARMGHSTPGAAQLYMHARAERNSRLAAALGEAMSTEGSLPQRP